MSDYLLQRLALIESEYRAKEHHQFADAAAEAIVKITALQAIADAEDARTRDLEYPEFVPESVTDAAYASQADWWAPGQGDGHAVVLVPQLIESVTLAAYRATVKHLGEVEHD